MRLLQFINTFQYFFLISSIFFGSYVIDKVSSLSERISVKKCKEYNNLYRMEFADPIFKEIKEYGELECPKFTSLGQVVGGRDAFAFEYPSMTSLMYPDKNGTHISKCGGVLISEQFVLTAAHCFKKEKPQKVVLGEINLKAKLSTLRQELGIAQIIVHPQYKPPAASHDIALIKLAQPFSKFRFGPRQPIRPVCLQQDEIRSSIKFEATGFGRLEAFGEAATTLQTVQLPTVDIAECSDFYRDSLDFSLRYPGVSEVDRDSWNLPSTNLCAGGVEGKDTCQGDSGGPLFYSPNKEYPCHRNVVGITSFGASTCGVATPGVYTKVSSYIDWIEGHAWPSS